MAKRVPLKRFSSNEWTQLSHRERVFYAGRGQAPKMDNRTDWHYRPLRPTFKQHLRNLHDFLNQERGLVSSRSFEYWKDRGRLGKAGLLLTLCIIGVFAVDQALKSPNTHGLLGGKSPLDPTTQIFISTNYGDFNTFLTSSSTGILLNSNSTFTAVALTKVPIGDLGVSNGKMLSMSFDWTLNSGSAGPGFNIPWGMYLTTNATVPLTATYDPQADKSVVLLYRLTQTDATHTLVSALVQKRVAETVASEDSGNCSQGGSAFVCLTYSISLGSSLLQGLTLNYTGTVEASGACGTLNHNAGCSYVNVATEPAPPVSSAAAYTNTLPWFQSTSQYYLGFYARYNLPFVPKIDFAGCGGSFSKCASVYTFNPTPPLNPNPVQPGIDTGGFFGPIIKALINIGVFILRATAQFFSFVSDAFITALDALGGFFGFGNIGTQLRTFFGGIVSFITNVIAVALNQMSNAFSYAGNVISAIVKITNGFWSNMTAFFSPFLGLLDVFWTVFGNVLIIFPPAYNATGLLLVFDVMMWVFWNAESGWTGTVKWVAMNRILLITVFDGVYWFLHQSWSMMLRIKNLVTSWI